MTTNNPETTATATAPQGVKPHRLIKLGVDVHWRQYVVVRQIDGAAPQPPQRFTPEEFVAWAKKQTQLADEVHCCYEAGPFGFVRSRSMGSGRNVQRGAVDTFAQAAHHGFTRFGLHVSP